MQPIGRVCEYTQWLPSVYFSILPHKAVADPAQEGGGGQEFSDESANVTKEHLVSEVIICVAWSLGPTEGPRRSGGFDAQVCILPHSGDTFSLISQ